MYPFGIVNRIEQTIRIHHHIWVSFCLALSLNRRHFSSPSATIRSYFFKLDAIPGLFSPYCCLFITANSKYISFVKMANDWIRTQALKATTASQLLSIRSNLPGLQSAWLFKNICKRYLLFCLRLVQTSRSWLRIRMRLQMFSKCTACETQICSH